MNIVRKKIKIKSLDIHEVHEAAPRGSKTSLTRRRSSGVSIAKENDAKHDTNSIWHLGPSKPGFKIQYCTGTFVAGNKDNLKNSIVRCENSKN